MTQSSNYNKDSYSDWFEPKWYVMETVKWNMIVQVDVVPSRTVDSDNVSTTYLVVILRVKYLSEFYLVIRWYSPPQPRCNF